MCAKPQFFSDKKSPDLEIWIFSFFDPPEEFQNEALPRK